jgi:DNA modification methylase
MIKHAWKLCSYSAAVELQMLEATEQMVRTSLWWNLSKFLWDKISICAWSFFVVHVWDI